MKRTVAYIALADMTFILLLSLSGSLSGVGGMIMRYAAYVLPCLTVLVLSHGKVKPLKLLPDGAALEYTATLAAPFVAIVFLISYLTSLLLGLFGISDSVDVSGNLALVIIEHALLPAILEEALFRYLPITLLRPHSEKNAVFISALFFAFAHCNLFQIPYALAAGLILSALTVATGSIFPAVILHFLNNLLSIIWMRSGGGSPFAPIFFSAIAAFAAVSVAVIFWRRKKYSEAVSGLICDKTPLCFPLGAALFVALTGALAVINIISAL